ncbi:MAG: hypothetical protein IJ870_05605, partial [Alphaproteobacteria bacterium]|nr:hypothetical protein [Alphaproteobacteria bacterium]
SKEAKSDRKKKYKTSDRRNTAGVSRRGLVGVTTKEPFFLSSLALCGASAHQGTSKPALCRQAHIRRFFFMPYPKQSNPPPEKKRFERAWRDTNKGRMSAPLSFF